MRVPPKWKRGNDEIPEAMRAIASLNAWSADGDHVMVVASYTFEQRDEAWLLDLIEQMLRQHFGGTGLGKAETSEATLAGRSARRLTWRGFVRGRIDALLIKRDSTFYAVVTIDKGGTTKTYDLARDTFSLLD